MESTALKKINMAEKMNWKGLPIRDTLSVALITGFIIFILTIGFAMNGGLNRTQVELSSLTERIDRMEADTKEQFREIHKKIDTIEADTKEQFREIHKKIDSMDDKLDQILLHRQNR